MDTSKVEYTTNGTAGRIDYTPPTAVIMTLFGEVQIENNRTCTKCNETLPEENFPLRSIGSNERRNQCNPCMNLQKRYLSVIKRNYGKIDQSSASCEICKSTYDDLKDIPNYNGSPFVYDHDHSNGKMRGILCQNCNTGIDRFRESIDALKNAINYLQKET